MAEDRRYALVVGSQCSGLPDDRRLSFLPELAEDLYEVLTDPDLGACAPALPDRAAGGLVLDPSRDELLESLESAFQTASEPGPDRAGSTLVLAMLGHGMAKEKDFYFLPHDGGAKGRTSSDVLLSQHLKELLRDYAPMKGLIVWLDTCQAGAAANRAVHDWTEMVLRQANRRFEVFVASDDRPAYRGDFTRLLLEKIKEGLKKDVERLGSHDLKPEIRLQDQRPQLITADSQAGTANLWISYNRLVDNRRKRIKADETAGQRAIDHSTRLVEFLQPTSTLKRLVQQSRSERIVVLTGYMGEGKSTLAAALAQPAKTNGHVEEGFVHAIAFGRQESYGSTLASTLAGQLRRTIPEFAHAADQFVRNHPGEGDQTDALERKVFGPMRLLDPDQTVRLVIDAFDELPDETQQAVRDVISSLTKSSEGAKSQPDIRFVLTSRPRPEGVGRWELKISEADVDALGAYFRDRGVDNPQVPRLVENAQGNWLHASLWANQAVSGSGVKGLSREGAASLADLYEAELEGVLSRSKASWDKELRPVLAVCAAVATNPRLPRVVAAVAAEKLGGQAANPGCSSRTR